MRSRAPRNDPDVENHPEVLEGLGRRPASKKPAAAQRKTTEAAEDGPSSAVTGNKFWRRVNPRRGVKRRCVVIYPWIAAVCSRLPPTLRSNTEKVVAALTFWFRLGRNGKLRVRLERDGHLWVAKTDAELARESLLPNVKSVRRAVAALREAGLLVRENWMFRRQRTGHYRFDWDALRAAAAAAGWKRRHELIGGSDDRDLWDD